MQKNPAKGKTILTFFTSRTTAFSVLAGPSFCENKEAEEGDGGGISVKFGHMRILRDSDLILRLCLAHRIV